jgi:hypothetical protein
VTYSPVCSCLVKLVIFYAWFAPSSAIPIISTVLLKSSTSYWDLLFTPAVTMGWDCVSVELRLLMGPPPIPQMTHEWIWSSGGIILTGKTEGLGEEPVPVPLCSSQILRGLIWERIRTPSARSRRRTTFAMARPFFPLPAVRSVIFTSPYVRNNGTVNIIVSREAFRIGTLCRVVG